MLNYLIDKVCCINNEDILENEQHNSFNKRKSLTSNSSNESTKYSKTSYPIKYHLPSNEIKFKQNENTKITSLSNLPIGISNIIRKQNDSPFKYYKIIKCIGNGSYGNVYKAEHKITKSIRSIKIIPKDNLVLGFTELDIIQEIDILKNIEYPYCVKLFEFYSDKDNYYLVNEYCSDGDLNEKLSKIKYFPEELVQVLMFQIFSGVAYLHSKNIFHGDLKLENIMVDGILDEDNNRRRKSFISSILEDKEEINNNIYKYHNSHSEYDNNNNNLIHKSLTYNKNLNHNFKTKLNNINIRKSEIKNFELKFIDFGCAKMFNRYKKNFDDTIGTLQYCSPEVLLNNYNEKCDIWSCGVILYVLLSGTYPFNGKNDQEISKKILNGKFEFNSSLFNNISNEAKDLIKKCLIYDKNERISAIKALKHPFFTNKLNLNDLYNENVNCKNTLLSIRNLSFSKHSKLYQIVLTYLSHNFAEKKYLEKLKKVFFKIDLKFNGKLSSDELYKAYKKEGIDIDLNEIEKIIESIDFNNNGYIDYGEFIRMTIPKESLFTNLNLFAAFNYLDLNKKGFICLNDIQEVLNLKSDDENIINELKNEFPNNKYKINFDEFKTMMISYAQEDMFNSIMRKSVNNDDFSNSNYYYTNDTIDENSFENSLDNSIG